MADRSELSTAKRVLLDQWRAGRLPAAPAGITAAPLVRRARASIQQLELWNLHQRSPGTSSPNISFAATLDAEVDTGALAQAVKQLSARHETLRTTLSADHGVVWQDIHDQPQAELTTIDLSALEPGTALARAHELANEAVAQAFDVSSGPLVRALLYRLGLGRHMLAVVVHHAVADGWSLAIAMSETAQLYEAIVRGAPANLPPLPIRYSDFARWQWQWMDGTEAREHARYWEHRIRPHSATQLPSDFAPGDKPDFRGGLAVIALPPVLCAAVRGLAAAQDASVFMVLIAAFAVLLRERTGDRLVSIGIPVACRPRAETRPLIGCFAGMVPMFVTVADGAPFSELLRAVRAESASAVTHEAYPLDMYLNRVEPDRMDFASRPLFTAQFGLQPPMQPFRLAGARLAPVTLNRGQTRTPFAVHLWNGEVSIHGTVGYSTALFREPAVNAMIKRYIEIVGHAAADPVRPVSEL